MSEEKQEDHVRAHGFGQHLQRVQTLAWLLQKQKLMYNVKRK